MSSDVEYDIIRGHKSYKIIEMELYFPSNKYQQ